MTLAHPLDQPGGLPFSPFFFGCAGAVILWTIAYWKGGGDPAGAPSRPFGAWEEGLLKVQWVTRLIAIFVLGLCIAAGRLGSENELDNLAPAFVIGIAWPLLVLTSALLGPVWRWLDPWDGLGRISAEDDGEGPSPNVLWAALPALAWSWYLFGSNDTLSPRAIGMFLAAYTIATVAGCLAMGRRRWMGQVESFGIFLSWVARIRHRGFHRWTPPAGAELVLGILLGGAIFGAFRYSEIGGFINDPVHGDLYRAIGVAAFGLSLALSIWCLDRWAARRGGRGSVVVAAIPAAASVLFASSMVRSRLFTSLQLLPSLAGDPLGEGWDLLGAVSSRIDPNLLGTTGRISTQAAVVFIGHLIGVVFVRRLYEQSARVPAIVFLSLSVVVGIVAISVN